MNGQRYKKDVDNHAHAFDGEGADDVLDRFDGSGVRAGEEFVKEG